MSFDDIMSMAYNTEYGFDMNGKNNRKISSVICEYNPFHNGHEYMLKKMRENGADYIVACMSGNFVQRGSPAIYDKYTRTRAALCGGADLVIELPVTFSCACAERFAYGGAFLLNALGCVDEIVFGSECGNIDFLRGAALAVENIRVSETMRSLLETGVTFARARQTAVEKIYGSEISDILSEPNNILAVEYIKALNRIGSDIMPSTLKRTGAGHDSCNTHQNIASAKHIRYIIEKGGNADSYMSECASRIFSDAKNKPPVGGRMSKLEGAVLYSLRMADKGKLFELPEVSEGLENRIYSAVKGGKSLEEIIDSIKSKRYTRSRICRIIMYAFLNIAKADMQEKPGYIKILGFNGRGREILKKAKETSSLPIVMRYADIGRLGAERKKMFELESRCDDIFALSGENTDICGRNLTEKIIITD